MSYEWMGYCMQCHAYAKTEPVVPGSGLAAEKGFRSLPN